MKRPLLLVVVIAINAVVFASFFFFYKFVFSRSEYGSGKNFPAIKSDYSTYKIIDTGMDDLHGIASGKNGYIFFCGDEVVKVLNGNFDEEKRFKIAPDAKTLAVSDEAIYIGYKDHVDVYDAGGGFHKTWQNLGNNALVTSIAVSDEFVFIADAGNKLVYKYDKDGRLTGTIDGNFIIPSPYFDVAIDDDSLWIINPGRQRVENYGFDGNLRSVFGSSSVSTEGFSGCCNPANICVNDSGGILTVEKGTIRIKEYLRSGKLKGIVAGEEYFKDHTTGPVFDIACAGDFVLVLDNEKKTVIVFDKRR